MGFVYTVAVHNSRNSLIMNIFKSVNISRTYFAAELIH